MRRLWSCRRCCMRQRDATTVNAPAALAAVEQRIDYGKETRQEGRPTPNHGPATWQPHQVRPRHHAEGQGPQRRPRPPADAHLDHVPQVPRRLGTGGGNAGGDRRQEVPHGHRTALSLAGLGRQKRRHHRRRARQVHQPRRGRPARRHEGRGPSRISPGAARAKRRRPPRRDRQRLSRRPEPHDLRLPAPRRGQSDRRHPFQRRGRNPHARPSLRIDAPRDARCGGRFGRILHAAAGRPLHGRSHRSAAWGGPPRPGLRHRRVPRRNVSRTWRSSARRCKT